MAITCGSSKPNDLEFLSETIEELDYIIGLGNGDDHIDVSLQCIVCKPKYAEYNLTHLIIFWL